MTSARLRNTLLGLCLAIVAPASATAAQDTPSARGLELVQRNCGMCHAVGRSGASPNPTAPPFRDLNQRYPVDNLAEALAEGILTGHPQMPEFQFSADQVQDILQYLNSIQTKQPADAGRSPMRQAAR